jgi:hypothetical protein
MLTKYIFLVVFTVFTCFAQADIYCDDNETSDCTKCETPQSVSFSPSKGVNTTVGFDNNVLYYRLTVKEKVNTAVKLPHTESDIRTAKAINIDDYNFDGLQDFSVVYADGGMGTNSVYRVFTYSKNTAEFVERFPSNGDEFFNLVVDKKRKMLLSTCWNNVDNEPKHCITKFHKN